MTDGEEPASAPDAIGERCRANLAGVRSAIAAACRVAGRDPAEVRLVGVTKQVPVAWAGLLLDAGCHDLGESRPQAVWERAATLPSARWHLIGPLQRNKVRRTLPLLTLLHTLDSRRLLDAIVAESSVAGRSCELLVEVNLEGSAGRSGLRPDELPGLLDAAAASPTVRIRGLMGMASAPGPGVAPDLPRRQFAALRSLRDLHRRDHPGLVELSMGMSGDFADAILEGATIVRIGSALWEGMDRPSGVADPAAPIG